VEFTELETFVDRTATTALLVVIDGETVVEIDRCASGPGWLGLDGQSYLGEPGGGVGLPFVPTPDGRMRHDVASAQKSIVAVLIAIAAERGLLTFADPVSDHLGDGWSRAGEREGDVTLHHLLTMTSGLSDTLEYQVPPGARWRYSLGPAWHLLKPVVAAAAGSTLDDVTAEWLTGPLAMAETEWIDRPGMAYLDGKPFEALLTSARDLGRFGQMILGDGEDVVAGGSLAPLFEPSQDLNPAYGLLWWLNGKQPHLIPMNDDPIDNVFMPDAPDDAVVALGAMGQVCAVVPSRQAVVVRLGAATSPGGVTGGPISNDLWPLLDRTVFASRHQA
jgi:CubicO group peptidase (beta-lactamase class C family)